MKSFSVAVVTVARYHPADIAAALALVQLVPSALTSWYSCPLRIGIACASCGTVVALSNAAARYRRFEVDIFVPPTYFLTCKQVLCHALLAFQFKKLSSRPLRACKTSRQCGRSRRGVALAWRVAALALGELDPLALAAPEVLRREPCVLEQRREELGGTRVVAGLLVEHRLAHARLGSRVIVDERRVLFERAGGCATFVESARVDEMAVGRAEPRVLVAQVVERRDHVRVAV